MTKQQQRTKTLNFLRAWLNSQRSLTAEDCAVIMAFMTYAYDKACK